MRQWKEAGRDQATFDASLAKGPAAFHVSTGPPRHRPQGHGKEGDAVNGPAQSGDLGEPLAPQVVLEGQSKGVEGLVVVQDPLALTDVGSHSPGLGAHRPDFALLLVFLGAAVCSDLGLAVAQEMGLPGRCAMAGTELLELAHPCLRNRAGHDAIKHSPETQSVLQRALPRNSRRKLLPQHSVGLMCNCSRWCLVAGPFYDRPPGIQASPSLSGRSRRGWRAEPFPTGASVQQATPCL